MASVRHYLVSLGLLATLFSCNFTEDKRQRTNPALTGERSYIALRNTIFQPRCNGCHNPAGQSGIDLTTYEKLMASGVVIPNDPQRSRLYLSLIREKQFMPQNGKRLSEAEITWIKEWISAGAPNETQMTHVVLPAKTYEYVYYKVFSTYCISCHSGTQPKGDFVLSSYEKMMEKDGAVVPGDPESSVLYVSVDGGVMPPNGSIPAEDVELIRDWITVGAPEK